MNPAVFPELAKTIIQWLRDNPDKPAPSVRMVAGQWRVSHRTAWKATRLLINKGVLESRPGYRIMRVVKGPAEVAQNPYGKLFAAIKNGVLDGTYPAGKPFPKIGYFAVQENLSRPTVSLAFARLAAEGLAYCVKNRWYAGPAPSRGAPAGPSVHDAPVVLFLVQNPQAFSTYFEDSYTSRFVLPFLNELLGHGIHATPALRSNNPQDVIAIPVGPDEVKAKIRSLKNRYHGTLILCVFPDVEDLAMWITALSAFHKPVIWFDYANKGELLTRRETRAGKGYFRMYQDERSALRLALEALLRQGHSVIGVHGAEHFDWGARRAERLLHCAAGLSPAPRIVVASDPAEAYWQFSKSTGIHEVLSATIKEFDLTGDNPLGGHPAKPMVRSLLDKTPSFVNLLRDHAPTALIALNDHMAREYYYWFTAAGLHIPKDFSIISFDNLFASMFFPITTIDFGFERLGYQAAHIIIGDIPIRANRYGNIPGPCTLIDRGSLGPPGDPGVIRRLVDA